MLWYDDQTVIAAFGLGQDQLHDAPIHRLHIDSYCEHCKAVAVMQDFPTLHYA